MDNIVESTVQEEANRKYIFLKSTPMKLDIIDGKLVNLEELSRKPLFVSETTPAVRAMDLLRNPGRILLLWSMSMVQFLGSLRSAIFCDLSLKMLKIQMKHKKK
jgi:hypothetical protein